MKKKFSFSKKSDPSEGTRADKMEDLKAAKKSKGKGKRKSKY